MSQTRSLAATYRKTTGQSLPVTMELARFDAIRLLGLESIEESDDQAKGMIKGQSVHIQIKGRVIFSNKKSRQRVGQLNFSRQWDATLLVIYDSEYQPQSIYYATRDLLEQQSNHENKRGSMTVAKFKAIGEQVWQAEQLSDHRISAGN